MRSEERGCFRFERLIRRVKRVFSGGDVVDATCLSRRERGGVVVHEGRARILRG